MVGTMKRATFQTAVVRLFAAIVLVATTAAQSKQSADLIITGGLVVSMNPERAIYQDGSVAINNDSIIAVGPRAEVESKYHAAQTIDARANSSSPASSTATLTSP